MIKIVEYYEKHNHFEIPYIKKIVKTCTKLLKFPFIPHKQHF